MIFFLGERLTIFKYVMNTKDFVKWINHILIEAVSLNKRAVRLNFCFHDKMIIDSEMALNFIGNGILKLYIIGSFRWGSNSFNVL